MSIFLLLFLVLFLYEYFRELETKILILPEVSSLSMIRLFDNALWRSC